MKKWFTSKTFWVNAILLAILIAQKAGDYSWISPAILAGILGGLNIILRALTNTATEIPIVSEIIAWIHSMTKPANTTPAAKP